MAVLQFAPLDDRVGGRGELIVDVQSLDPTLRLAIRVGVGEGKDARGARRKKGARGACRKKGAGRCGKGKGDS